MNKEVVILGVVILIVFFQGVMAEECSPYWYCYEWGECMQGEQQRTCYDANNCGLGNGPPLMRECGNSSQSSGSGDSEVDIVMLNFQIRQRNAIVIGIGAGIVLLGALVFIVILYRQRKMMERRNSLLLRAGRSFGERISY